MRSIEVCDCEILSIHSGQSDCPLTGDKVPVLLVAIRLVGHAQPVNLAIRNPERLLTDVPSVFANSACVGPLLADT